MSENDVQNFESTTEREINNIRNGVTVREREKARKGLKEKGMKRVSESKSPTEQDRERERERNT